MKKETNAHRTEGNSNQCRGHPALTIVLILALAFFCIGLHYGRSALGSAFRSGRAFTFVYQVLNQGTNPGFLVMLLLALIIAMRSRAKAVSRAILLLFAAMLVVVTVRLAYGTRYICREYSLEWHEGLRWAVRGPSSSQRRLLFPDTLLKEGTFVRDFPGFLIYIGSKDGNRLSGVRIHDLTTETEVVADSGLVSFDRDDNKLLFTLYSVEITGPRPGHTEESTNDFRLRAERWNVSIDCPGTESER